MSKQSSVEGTLDVDKMRRLRKFSWRSGTEAALQEEQGLGGSGWVTTFRQKAKQESIGWELCCHWKGALGARPEFSMELRMYRVAEGNEIARCA